jgi:hypothetical protein
MARAKRKAARTAGLPGKHRALGARGRRQAGRGAGTGVGPRRAGIGLGPASAAQRRRQPSHNLFGIKAGASLARRDGEAATTEYVGGAALKTSARFRSYPDQASAFRDYAQMLSDNPRFRDALGAGSDAQAFAAGLAKGGYATDPAYAAKLERAWPANCRESRADGLPSTGSTVPAPLTRMRTTWPLPAFFTRTLAPRAPASSASPAVLTLRCRRGAPPCAPHRRA